ncbi:Anxa6 protein [Tribonema minus]|uniref:Anxa6 protein n=1 Tax=Tribonema minus TaxID=303371 RepID=A0A835YT40_9STRA|nr:Anxa6 protein [Tribonema minus]
MNSSVASSLHDIEACTDPGVICQVLAGEVETLTTFVAYRDANDIREATSGLGTDETALIGILCNRTKSQMHRIDRAVHALYEKSLLQVVDGDIGGHFGDMVSYALQPKHVLGSLFLTKACSGVGCDESVVIDLVCTHNNEELEAIQAHWSAANDKPMIDKINAELDGDFKKLVIKLFQGCKSESTDVDENLAAQQATELYKATFARILGEASRAQIQAIKAAYERAQGASLQRAIEKECNGHFKRLLVALLAPSREAYIATALYRAFEGVGTNDARVARMLGCVDKPEMAAVCAYYVDTWGVALVEAIRDELSGCFEDAAVAWVAATDPTQGLEYANRGLPEDGGDDARSVAKAFFNERAALTDYIAQARPCLTVIAVVDAVAIRRACKGIGTKDKALIEVLCARSKDHLKRVNAYYHSLFGTSLLAEVHDETTGYYRQLMEYALMPTDDLDAMVVKQACDGLGTDETLLVEALAPLSNSRMIALKAKFEAKYGQPLIDRMNSELSGTLRTVIVALLRAVRDEGSAVDSELAANQAEQLHAAGAGRLGTDEETFISILTRASFEQVQAIKAAYERAQGASLESAIRSESRGDAENALLALLRTPHAGYAAALKRAFRGLGTDDAAVARALGSNDKPDVARIADIYLENFGQTLVEALKEELSGSFRLAAVTWVAAAAVAAPSDIAALTRDMPQKQEEERAPAAPAEAPEIPVVPPADLPAVTVVVAPQLAAAAVTKGEGKGGDDSDSDSSTDESSDGHASEASAHSSDGEGAEAQGWVMTPELQHLFALRRKVQRNGNKHRTRMLTQQIRAAIAAQQGAPAPVPKNPAKGRTPAQKRAARERRAAAAAAAAAHN